MGLRTTTAFSCVHEPWFTTCPLLQCTDLHPPCLVSSAHASTSPVIGNLSTAASCGTKDDLPRNPMCEVKTKELHALIAWLMSAKGFLDFAP